MREYALVLLVTATVTYLLVPLVRRIAVRTHAMHEPRARDMHTHPTPLLGGLAMYGGMVAGLLIASRLTFLADPFQTAGSRTEAGLLMAGGLIVVVGFVDDRWGLSAISKLGGQVAAAGLVVWSGQSLPWIPTPNGRVFVLEQDLSVTLTILLVVITINAINFIDGLDGLAAGIVAVAALSFLVYSYSLVRTLGNPSLSLPAVSSALLAGMCIGFLPHNFYPARIFMGDTGAMLLGLLLAYGPISSTESLDPSLLSNYTQYHVVNRYGTILPLLVPAAIFLVPYADLMLAVIRRTRRGKPVMAADREHLHHRLLGIGHSYRQSVLIMWLWAALFSSAVVSLSLVRTRLWVLAAVTVFAVLTLLPVTMPRLRPWRLFSATRPDAGPGAAEGRGVAGRGVAGRAVAPVAGRGVAGRGVAPAAGRGVAPAAGEAGIPAVAAPGTAARAAANGRRAAHARRPAPRANAATNGSTGSGSAGNVSTGNVSAGGIGVGNGSVGGNGAGNGSAGGNGRIPGPGPAERALRPFPADADSAASGPDRVTGLPPASGPSRVTDPPHISGLPRASDPLPASDSTRVAGSGRVVRRLFDDQFADTEPFPAPPNPDARPR